MKSTTGSLLLASALALSGAAQAVVIDQFDDPNTLTLNGGGPSGISGGATAPGIIGGQRELHIDRLVPGTALSIETGAQTFQPAPPPGVGLDPRRFVRFTSQNAPGVGLISWDGQPAGDTNNSIDFTGLGGEDLTENGTQNALRFDLVSADPGRVPGVGTPQSILPVYFFVFTDAANFSIFRYDAEGRSESDPNSLEIIIPFADFLPSPGSLDVPVVPMLASGVPIPGLNALTPAGPADFANVGAVALLIDASVNEAFDFAIDVLETTQTEVPVPATVWLMAMIGGLMLRRRG